MSTQPNPTSDPGMAQRLTVRLEMFEIAEIRVEAAAWADPHAGDRIRAILDGNQQ